MQLTKEQRIFIVFEYETTKNYEQVKRAFNETFPERNSPNKKTVYRTVRKFNEHGRLRNLLYFFSEGECRAKCAMDSGCTAASYDAIADLCFMTDGGPNTVITQPLVGSVAFFKFCEQNWSLHFSRKYVETPLEVFLAETTKNCSMARLRGLCAEENGILIIKTEEVKTAATQLVNGPLGEVSEGNSYRNTRIATKRVFKFKTQSKKDVRKVVIACRYGGKPAKSCRQLSSEVYSSLLAAGREFKETVK
ncbi:Protein of unknown function DUF4817 [Trinorchestia longiramus]|nr:Protein of unknown function DUF4817 [Trinorchestia longiramus]